MNLEDMVADKVIKDKNFLERVSEKVVSLFTDTKPIKKDSSINFFKDKAGQWWFLGIYSNKFEDRDEEILSEKSHREYIAWLKDTGFKPVITTLHQPKMPQIFWPVVFDKFENKTSKLSEIVRKIYKDFAFAEAVRVMYVNGFTVVGAKVFPDKVNIAEALSKESDLGMSHGFIVKEFSDNIVDKYRTFEMSVLKRKRAANFITLSLFAAKDKLGMSNEKGLGAEDRQFLTSVYGEDVANSLEEGTKNIEEMLRGAGMSFKDFEEEDKAKKPADDETVEDTADTEDAADEKPTKKKESEEAVEEVTEVATEVVVVTPELIQGVVKALNLDALQEVLKGYADAVTELQATVKAQTEELTTLKATTKELEKSEDDKIAAAIAPSYRWDLIGLGASKSKENVVTEKDKKELEKAAPVGADGNKTPNAMDDFFMKSIFKGNGN